MSQVSMKNARIYKNISIILTLLIRYTFTYTLVMEFHPYFPIQISNEHHFLRIQLFFNINLLYDNNKNK